MRDLYSNDTATAGYLARSEGIDYGDDRPTRAELDAEEHSHHPAASVDAGTGNELLDGITSALLWSIAWAPTDVHQTAPGVAAFTPPAPATRIDPARVNAALTREGFETKTVDGLVYVRRARPTTGAA